MYYTSSQTHSIPYYIPFCTPIPTIHSCSQEIYCVEYGVGAGPEAEVYNTIGVGPNFCPVSEAFDVRSVLMDDHDGTSRDFF